MWQAGRVHELPGLLGTAGTQNRQNNERGDIAGNTVAAYGSAHPVRWRDGTSKTSDCRSAASALAVGAACGVQLNTEPSSRSRFRVYAVVSLKGSEAPAW